jgi:hypothetical protein
MEVTGDVLFARYAFPPNELGYCGPDDPGVLLRHATSGREPAAEIARRARLFEGAWVYLELIAAASGIADPMDARVVEAYWIGNELLDAVDPTALLTTLRVRFAGQLVGPAARRWRTMPPAHALAHHGFHVFAVYPWAGLLGVRSDTALSVLDSCRIRWGTVVGVAGARANVRTRRLAWDGRRLAVGAEHVESVRWSAGDPTDRRPPVPGEVVSCHWDWVCDTLTRAQVAELAARQTHQLTALALHGRP